MSHIQPYTLSAGDYELINNIINTTALDGNLLAFKVKIADNNIDNDKEAFTLSCLQEMQQEFIGKEVKKNSLFNGYIFNTTLFNSGAEDNFKTKYGEPLWELWAYVFMPKTSQNEDFYDLICSGLDYKFSLAVSVLHEQCVSYTALTKLKEIYEWGLTAVEETGDTPKQQISKTISLDLHVGTLIAEVNNYDGQHPEMAIYFENNDGEVQDICLVRPQSKKIVVKKSQKNASSYPNKEDTIECLVWEDELSDAFTKKITFPIYSREDK